MMSQITNNNNEEIRIYSINNKHSISPTIRYTDLQKLLEYLIGEEFNKCKKYRFKCDTKVSIEGNIIHDFKVRIKIDEEKKIINYNYQVIGVYVKTIKVENHE